jgi:DNA polymerase (family 10)
LKEEDWDGIVQPSDINGIVHNHSTWSDGIHTLEEMSLHVRDEGYAYFAICDHSQSAFYANGLQPERVLQQMEEIDTLNRKLAPFRIFKGIESDILNDGSLDYTDDMLAMFDLVVASIHSNLRMDEDKATTRLIKAIENPYTRILGHPTSRLLLARPGYPIDYKKVIDACAANGVVMELNANPQRMDIDYHWLPYCQEKGVMVAINPDAHSRGQVGYVKYGVSTARKGMLKKANCLNTKSLAEFEKWIALKGR